MEGIPDPVRGAREFAMGPVGITIVVVLVAVFAVAAFYDLKRRRSRHFSDGGTNTRHQTKREATGRADRLGPGAPGGPDGNLGL